VLGNVTQIIDSNELLAFAQECPDFLPARVQAWFELANGWRPRRTQ
jgi:hypothetical protein